MKPTSPRPSDAGDPDGPEDDRPMTLADHLNELRVRLFRAVLWVAAAAILVEIWKLELMGVVLQPYAASLEKAGGSISTTEISENFFVFMKFDIVLGLFFASPFVLREVWGFVAKGLYEKERRVVRVVAPVSMLLFVGGCAFYYFVIQPPAVEFLLTSNLSIPLPNGSSLQIRPMPRLDNALGFFLTMSLVMGLVFELPLVMVAAQQIGVCSWRTFSKYRRHFFMGSMVGMAILTPSGDAFSLFLCMIPVLFLFEGGIVTCWLMNRNVPKDEDDEEKS